MTPFEPVEFATQARESRREAEVAAWLRSLPEPDRFGFVRRVLGLNPGAGLDLVERCQLGRASLLEVLERGLDVGDASTVRWWLEATIPGLGFRRVVETVARRLPHDPDPVDSALYWLGGLAGRHGERARRALNVLAERFGREHRGPRSGRQPPTTEEGWPTAGDPLPMLRSPQVRGSISPRKLRLFANACVLRVRHLLAEDRCRQAAEVAGRYADGQAGKVELEAARRAASEAEDGGTRAGWLATDAARWTTFLRTAPSGEEAESAGALAAAHQAADRAARAVAAAAGEGGRSDASWSKALVQERAAQATLLRCVAGNPFRPPVIDPSWIAWNGGAVVGLSRTIYEERRFEDVPVLADALEEAGCRDEGVLGHLRGPGPHARGCFVIDLLKGGK